MNDTLRWLISFMKKTGSEFLRIFVFIHIVPGHGKRWTNSDVTLCPVGLVRWVKDKLRIIFADCGSRSQDSTTDTLRWLISFVKKDWIWVFRILVFIHFVPGHGKRWTNSMWLYALRDWCDGLRINCKLFSRIQVTRFDEQYSKVTNIFRGERLDLSI